MQRDGPTVTCLVCRRELRDDRSCNCYGKRKIANLERDLLAARQEVTRLREALAFYADSINYARQPDRSGHYLEIPVDEDRGRRARAALATGCPLAK